MGVIDFKGKINPDFNELDFSIIKENNSKIHLYNSVSPNEGLCLISATRVFGKTVNFIKPCFFEDVLLQFTAYQMLYSCWKGSVIK